MFPRIYKIQNTSPVWKTTTKVIYITDIQLKMGIQDKKEQRYFTKTVPQLFDKLADGSVYLGNENAAQEMYTEV